jgi:hypothetical protein
MVKNEGLPPRWQALSLQIAVDIRSIEVHAHQELRVARDFFQTSLEHLDSFDRVSYRTEPG